MDLIDERTTDVRKIINSTYISLDGVVEGPHLWPSLGRPSDERADQIQADLVLSCDAMLMGRHTYDGFAPVWPTRSGDPISDQFNTMPKYVVSTTLKDPEWNNTRVIDGDAAAEITQLKRSPGRDIVQYGFGAVSRLLLEHGLLDELRLWVHPLIVGAGRPGDLLFGAAPAVGFDLTDTTTLSNGIVILSYRMDKTLAAAA
jgi:dihydrofolate reductase